MKTTERHTLTECLLLEFKWTLDRGYADCLTWCWGGSS